MRCFQFPCFILHDSFQLFSSRVLCSLFDSIFTITVMHIQCVSVYSFKCLNSNHVLVHTLSRCEIDKIQYVSPIAVGWWFQRYSHYYTMYCVCRMCLYLFLYWRFARCWNSFFVLLNLLNWSCVVIQSNDSSDFKCKILFEILSLVTGNFLHFRFYFIIVWHIIRNAMKIVFCSSYWMMPHSLSCYVYLSILPMNIE